MRTARRFSGIFVTRQRVLCLTSLRPIHQRCLEAERLQVARACMLVRRWSRSQYVLSFRVDEVFCRVAKNAREQFKGVVEGVRYCDLAGILPQGPFGVQRPIDQRPQSSSAPVFRVKFVEKAVYPGGVPKIRKAEVPHFEPTSWQTIEEGLD